MERNTVVQFNTSRRNFIRGLAGATAVGALPGCCSFCSSDLRAKVALQLYSIRQYIAGKKGRPGVGLAKALADIAKIGYRGVEFAGYYGNDAKTLSKMLADNGLKACGTHIGRDEFGPDKVKATCEFNLGFGNNLLICPGGGNFPGKKEDFDDFMKRLVDFYNRAAEDAGRLGYRVGLHNHMREFTLKMKDGTTYWDYFFRNTDPRVCMEQDVGWTTCAGVDPKEQYAKYPHRSPTLHAKENGMGKDVKEFDAILGQPGRPGAIPVDWAGLIPVTEKDGVEWYVVECERHEDGLSAVGPSYEFLRSMGLNG